MMDAVIAVRRAIQARLVADTALVTLLGGPRIHDEPPRAATGPYIVYGDVEARDWSSSTELGCEQAIEIVVWAPRSAETSVALAIAGRVGLVLHDAPLVPVGHRLVQIRQTGLDVRRDAKTGLSRVVVRLRCVTDQL
jgi:hypothetical protein